MSRMYTNLTDMKVAATKEALIEQTAKFLEKQGSDADPDEMLQSMFQRYRGGKYGNPEGFERMVVKQLSNQGLEGKELFSAFNALVENYEKIDISPEPVMSQENDSEVVYKAKGNEEIYNAVVTKAAELSNLDPAQIEICIEHRGNVDGLPEGVKEAIEASIVQAFEEEAPGLHDLAEINSTIGGQVLEERLESNVLATLKGIKNGIEKTADVDAPTMQGQTHSSVSMSMGM